MKIILFRKNLTWHVSGKYNWPVSEYNISRLLGRLRHFQIHNSLNIKQTEKEGESLSDYGLLDPNIIIDIVSTFGKISLHFGNETRNGEKVYMLLSNESKKANEIFKQNYRGGGLAQRGFGRAFKNIIELKLV